MRYKYRTTIVYFLLLTAGHKNYVCAVCCGVSEFCNNSRPYRAFIYILNAAYLILLIVNVKKKQFSSDVSPCRVRSVLINLSNGLSNVADELIWQLFFLAAADVIEVYLFDFILDTFKAHLILSTDLCA